MSRSWVVCVVVVVVLAGCAEKSRPEPSTPRPTEVVSVDTEVVDEVKEPSKMQTADWHGLAREALRGSGVAGVEELRFSGGPGWMFDPEATGPFLFYVGTGGGGRPGREEVKHCVAIDTRSKAAYYKKVEGFQEFLSASGFVGERGRLDGRQLLETWYVFQHGVPPTVLLNPASVKDEALRAVVQVPEVQTEGDATVVVGWTARMRYSYLERHRITIDGGGKVSVVTQTAADVLAEKR